MTKPALPDRLKREQCQRRPRKRLPLVAAAPRRRRISRDEERKLRPGTSSKALAHRCRRCSVFLVLKPAILKPQVQSEKDSAEGRRGGRKEEANSKRRGKKNIQHALNTPPQLLRMHFEVKSNSKEKNLSAEQIRRGKKGDTTGRSAQTGNKLGGAHLHAVRQSARDLGSLSGNRTRGKEREKGKV